LEEETENHFGVRGRARLVTAVDARGAPEVLFFGLECSRLRRSARSESIFRSTVAGHADKTVVFLNGGRFFNAGVSLDKLGETS
jgi:hypothetical protein